MGTFLAEGKVISDSHGVKTSGLTLSPTDKQDCGDGFASIKLGQGSEP